MFMVDFTLSMGTYKVMISEDETWPIVDTFDFESPNTVSDTLKLLNIFLWDKFSSGAKPSLNIKIILHQPEVTKTKGTHRKGSINFYVLITEMCTYFINKYLKRLFYSHMY